MGQVFVPILELFGIWSFGFWHSTVFCFHNGQFVNDVTQAGGMDSHFFETMFEGLNKTGNLV